MEVSANFAFLKQEFPHVAESASYAEHHVYGDPRASCFHARHALERLVKRVYKVEKTLSPPKVTNLDAYLGEPAFRAILPEVVWQKAEYIRKAGNTAVHGNRTPAPEQALNVVRELAHVLYWAGRTYLRKGRRTFTGRPSTSPLSPPWSRAPRRPASRNWTPSRANWTQPTTHARRSKASWRRCVDASPPSRRRTRASPRPVTGTRARPAG